MSDTKAGMVAMFAWNTAMLRTADISHPAKATLAALATWANNDTYDCFRTQADLAGDIGVTTRTVRNHLQEAVDAGWLVRVKRGASGRATDYRLAYGVTRKSELPGAMRKPVSGSGGNVLPVEGEICFPPTTNTTTHTTKNMCEIELEPIQEDPWPTTQRRESAQPIPSGQKDTK